MPLSSQMYPRQCYRFHPARRFDGIIIIPLRFYDGRGGGCQDGRLYRTSASKGMFRTITPRYFQAGRCLLVLSRVLLPYSPLCFALLPDDSRSTPMSSPRSLPAVSRLRASGSIKDSSAQSSSPITQRPHFCSPAQQSHRYSTLVGQRPCTAQATCRPLIGSMNRMLS